MSSEDISWMPTQGKQTINMGSSAIRALKARKGISNSSKTKLPEKEFYGFRYSFKPPTLEPLKGTLDVKTVGEPPDHLSTFSMEQVSAVPGESLLFEGQTSESKISEMDYILMYDEEMGTYTLEKLDTTVTVLFRTKLLTKDSQFRSSSSPHPQPGDATSVSNAGSIKQEPEEQEEGDEVQTPLVQQLKSKPTEPVPVPSPLPPVAPAPLKKRPVPKPRGRAKPPPAPVPVVHADEEREEGEEIEIPLKQTVTKPSENKASTSKIPAASMDMDEIIDLPRRPPSPVPAPPQTVSRATRPPRVPRPTAKSRLESSVNKPAAVPLPPPPPSSSNASSSSKRELRDEDFEFPPQVQSQPPPPRKKQRKSPSPPPITISVPAPPPPTSGGGLALPGSSGSAAHLPPALTVTAPPVEVVDDESEEEEWDEVPTAPAPVPVLVPAPAPVRLVEGMIEEGISDAGPMDDASDEEEIDINAFEAEMNQHLEDDDDADMEEVELGEEDFLAAAVLNDGEVAKPILSMSQLAGEGSGDEDDYSSSDDSDED